ncbi:MAG: 2-oxoacid:acceptor oxidoreductase family protein [Thermodesulfobacteriota bacterium]|nr:2-oxoacid:acceptor oxidoreductase family protein [Thermodesulfobacteriota bacterium]
MIPIDSKDPLNLIITGVGGQGNVLASHILGRAAALKGLRVTIGETFGLSQRGGPVMSHIRLSGSTNPGPLIPPNTAHIIVGLEPLETIRILMEYGNEQTIIIANSRPIYPLNVIAGEVAYPDPEWIKGVLAKSGDKLLWLEATRVAVDSGGPIMLNMIMLGALCSLRDFPLEIGDIKEVLNIFLPESSLKQNYDALDTGGGLASSNEN